MIIRTIQPRVMRQAGFTLTEVMIASVLLFIIFGTLVYAFVSARRTVTTAQNSMQAMHIARSVIENFRTGSYASINSYGPRALTNTVLSSLSGMETCTVSTSTNYKEIALTISWVNPAKSGISSQTFCTIIYNSD